MTTLITAAKETIGLVAAAVSSDILAHAVLNGLIWLH